MMVLQQMMLVVTLTFCIFSGIYSLPVSPYGAVDPYPVSPYPAVDPYGAAPVYAPPVDAYYQLPQPVTYPPVDPYAVPQPYPAVDPYAIPQPYPAVSPYGIPQPYPSSAVDPFSLYSQLNQFSVPSPQPYPSVYPTTTPQPYPSVDPYAQPVNPYQPQPPPQPYPSVDLYPPPPPQPYPSIDSYSLSIPQNNQVAPTYQQPPPPTPVVVQEDTYLAVTYHDRTDAYHKHCGILAATNNEIYSSDPSPGGVNDVLPYGAFPWIALIVDIDDNSVACLGTVIHSEYVLTTASCMTKPAGKYTVVRDWDILTIYNEYEAYRSYADPVCSYLRLGLDNSTEQTQYRVGGPEAELALLIGPLEEHHNKYPKDKVLCLPSKSSALPSPYSNPPPPPNPYLPSVYSPYPQISYSNQQIPTGECWVAGFVNSPTAVLQNHPPPTPVSGQPPQTEQQYYNSLDNSKVPRRALVRQIQCPPDRSYPGADDVCFVGVNGYDACVADSGSAVLCIIDEYSNYESGFSNDPTSDHNVIPEGITSSNPAPSQQPLQQQPIQVQPAQQKPNRRRAVLYAVVKVTTTCNPTSPPGYPPNLQQQSNYIVGARVSPSIRGAIQDLYWQVGFDLSCPAAKRSGDLIPNSQSGQASPPSNPQLQPQQYAQQNKW